MKTVIECCMIASGTSPVEWTEDVFSVVVKTPISGGIKFTTVFGDAWNCLGHTETISILDALVSVGLSESRGEAKKAIQGNGISVNGKKIKDVGMILSVNDSLLNIPQTIVLEKGKKNFGIIEFFDKL